MKKKSPSVSSTFSFHHFKDIPLLQSCAYHLAGFEEEQQPIAFHSSQWCSPGKLSALNTWGNFTWTVAVCISSKETELLSREGSRELSHCTALQDLCFKKPKVTSKGRRELANKHKTCVQISLGLQGFSRQVPIFFFWEFIGKYMSVLCCIDSEQHSTAELQHIWNNCFGFDSIITLMRKVSCLY